VEYCWTREAREEAEARTQLERAREATQRVRDLKANRRVILEAYGMGLQLGLYWFPPHLRNQVYAALGLVGWVSPEGLVSIEGSFDAIVIRLTHEVEEYARALMEVDERVREAPLEVVERELARVRDAQTPKRVCFEDTTDTARVPFRVVSAATWSGSQ
jgi:hypothetical protein